MANTIKWTAFEHSGSKQKGTGSHVILVAYMPTGSRSNKVIGVAPLFDLRDANLDGSVTILESFFSAEYANPSDVISLMNSSNAVVCVQQAAIKMHDFALVTQANSAFLQMAFKICQKAVVSIMVEKALGPGIELGLAKTALAKLGKVSDVAQFIVQDKMQNAIVDSICR